jgi:hypothetical protein
MAVPMRNPGMLVLAIYLIVVGVVGLTGIALPFPLVAGLALVAGVLILAGR